MASRWLVNNREDTWLTFRELVDLARSGELSQDNLVKAEWEPEWRPAHTVVGLFYRAKRSETTVTAETSEPPPPALQDTDPGFRIEDLEAAQELQAAGEIANSELSGWQKRLREVQESRTPETSPEKPSSSASNAMQLLFEAAMPRRQVSRWQQSFERWQARWNTFYEWLNTTAALRLIGGAVFSALLSWGLFNYARQAALRFPRADMPDRFVVPLLGDCTPIEFYFILAEFVILLMTLIYFGGMWLERWLESRTGYSQEAA